MQYSIQEYFRYSGHDNARVDGARNNQADGSNATLMDANCNKTQQKKKKMRQGWIYVYVAEDSFYFQEHGGIVCKQKN